MMSSHHLIGSPNQIYVDTPAKQVAAQIASDAKMTTMILMMKMWKDT